MRFAIAAGALLVLFVIFVATQMTFVAVQPIGALPEGAVFVVWRRGEMRLFDGPDAFCERVAGGVSLLCRSMALDAFVRKEKPIARLPFSWTLYDWSTGGKRYAR